MGGETNAPQFGPDASLPEQRVHPGLFRRRDGVVDLSTVAGPGFGYRCIVLRECTTAYEFPDTYEGRWMLNSLLRRVEYAYGYTASAQDFTDAALAAAGDNPREERQR